MTEEAAVKYCNSFLFVHSDYKSHNAQDGYPGQAVQIKTAARVTQEILQSVMQDCGTVNNIQLYAGFKKTHLNYSSRTALTSLPALCLNIELENLNCVFAFVRIC